MIPIRKKISDFVQINGRTTPMANITKYPTGRPRYFGGRARPRKRGDRSAIGSGEPIYDGARGEDQHDANDN